MAVLIASSEYIGQCAVALLRKYRCGFDNCNFSFDYFPMTDEVRFAAVGNIAFIYNLGRYPKHDDFLLSLIPKWSDPIC